MKLANNDEAQSKFSAKQFERNCVKRTAYNKVFSDDRPCKWKLFFRLVHYRHDYGDTDSGRNDGKWFQTDTSKPEKTLLHSVAVKASNVTALKQV
jgi:hypothetical protein